MNHINIIMKNCTDRAFQIHYNYQCLSTFCKHHTWRKNSSYYCRLSTALSLNTLGLSLSQSSDTLIAGSGHSPMISSLFLLSKARLNITPRKDTKGKNTSITTPSQTTAWDSVTSKQSSHHFLKYNHSLDINNKERGVLKRPRSWIQLICSSEL